MKFVVTIAVAVFIYVLQARLYRRYWDCNLKTTIYFSEDFIRVGDRAEIKEIINNAKKLPLPVFHVKYAVSRSFVFDDVDNATVTDSYHRNDVFSVMGNQKVTRTLPFTARKRGLFFINGVNITARDFFMVRSFAKNVKNNSSIYVLPERCTLPEQIEVTDTIIGELISRRSFVTNPFSFRGIRDYEDTDTMSSINWKASAKNDDLLVNIYEHTVDYRVTILLNMDANYSVKGEAIGEVNIKAANTFAGELAERGIPVRIISNGKDIVSGEDCCIGYGSSSGHVFEIEKCLARIDGDKGLSEFETLVAGEINSREEGTAYIVITSYCSNELLLKLDSLRASGRDVAVLQTYYSRFGFDKKREYIYGMEVKNSEVQS